MAQAKDQERLLAPGATHYIADPREKKVEVEIPEGVTIRSGKSVQIEFMWQGSRYTESLPGKPTDSAVRDAVTKRDSVLRDIRLNQFVYANHFPNSRRVAQARAQTAEANQQSQKKLCDLLDEWLEQYGKEHPTRHNTLATHREIVESRLKPAVLQIRPAEVTKDWVVNFRHSLEAEGLSEKRIKNVMTTLRLAMDMVVDRGLVARNAARDVASSSKRATNGVTLDESGNPSFDEAIPTSLNARYAEQAKKADPFLPDERKNIVARLLGQIRNFFLFAMWTGLRTGELIALRWCDVSPDGRRILVRLSFSKAVFTKTKGRRARWVDLTQPAIDVIKAQRDLTGAQGRWVFHNPKTSDRWQNSQRTRVHWMRALAAAGVRYRPQYQCRHTYASLMVSSGESPEWTAEQMGHLDGRLVAEVYARWLEPANFQPGTAAAQVYAAEWNEAAGLVSRENVQSPDEHEDSGMTMGDEDSEEEEDGEDGL